MRSLHQESISEQHLELIGSAAMSRGDVGALLDACTLAYDRAVAVRRTPFYGDFDLDPPARRCMIDGAIDLIDRGYHREAAWWIFAVHFFARTALRLDAREEYGRVYRASYEALLGALGIGTPQGLAAKAALAEELLSRVMVVAESIVRDRA
jgi:hypothetical protein